MSKVMMTIQSKKGPPELQVIHDYYGLKDSEIDKEFGVIEIDPEDGTYVILIEEDAAKKIVDTKDWKVKGPHSNPRIAPFGPPQTKDNF